MNGFLQDNLGNNSSMRLIVFLSVAVIIGVWAKISIVNNTMEPIPTEVAAILAAFIAGKVGQSWVEAQPARVEKP
jgi:uncharacterized membrane protein